MVTFDRSRMTDHIARQDDGYARCDADAIRNSTMTLKSRIHKELFLFSLIVESLRGDRPVRRLLEVGCGIGALTGALRSLADEIVAFDLSPAGVKAAEQTLAGWPGVTLCVADGTNPLASPEIATGGYDLILIREFHPFTRDLYADRGEADRVHAELLSTYTGLLAPGGCLILSHAEAHQQTIRPESSAITTSRFKIRRIDPRLLSAFLFLTRNRLGSAIRLTRFLQPLLWLITTRNVLYVLQRQDS